MIRLTRKQLLSGAFQKGFRKLMEQPLGLETSIALAKASRIVEKETENFTKLVRELLKKHDANPVANGFAFPSLEQQSAFLREQDSALEALIEIAPLNKIKLPESTNLSATDLAPLLEFIEEPRRSIEIGRV
jgi:hypothetical protein